MRHRGRIWLAVAAAFMFAGAGVQPVPAAEYEDTSVPGPLLIGAGLAAGMGLAMLVVFAAGRRSRAS